MIRIPPNVFGKQCLRVGNRQTRIRISRAERPQHASFERKPNLQSRRTSHNGNILGRTRKRCQGQSRRTVIPARLSDRVSTRRWKPGVRSRCDQWLRRRHKAVLSRRLRLWIAGFGRWRGLGRNCCVLSRRAGQRSVRDLNLLPAGYSSGNKSQNGIRREAGPCKTQSGASLPYKLAPASTLRTAAPFYVRS